MGDCLFLVYLSDGVVGLTYSSLTFLVVAGEPDLWLEDVAEEVPQKVTFFEDGAWVKAFVAGWDFAFNEGVLNWLHLPASV